MSKLRLLIFFYVFIIVGLFLYSYTQVDLSLTLSRLSLWQVIEKAFQYVGYFQRPFSTSIYILLILLLFTGQLGLVLAVQKKILPSKAIWWLILFTGGLLTFSYNAFSYDLFNYIFDAKVVTYYHSNPYHHYALQYPHDPMLSFMHWTQRTYPYGPLWLGITIPFSLIGGQIFLITFYLFKLIASLSYFGTAYFIGKIAKKISPSSSLFALTLFAFSPLVIVEGLVSAHNDMIMIFLSTLALYLLVSKIYVRSLLSLGASILVKFATAVWLPVWLGFFYFFKRKKNIPFDALMIGGALLGVIAVVLAAMRTNFQPWYLFYVLPFVFLTRKSYIFVAFSIFSFFALLEYVPFLYTGNWDPPIPILLSSITLIGIGFSVVAGLVLFIHDLTVAKRR